MPTIQILYNFLCSLSDYYKKIKGGFLIIPLFLDCCPICGGRDCAVFLGFYYRKVVDENGTFYKRFPILRYECKRKGFKNVDHRTFSLLPIPLIPYTKYSIPFIFKVLKKRHLEGKSINEALDFVAEMQDNGVICIHPATLYGFEKLFVKSTEKILTSGFLREFAVLILIPDILPRLKRFLEALEGRTDGRARDPCALGGEFYLEGGGYARNAHFLFGTPSQFRFRSFR